MKKTELKTPSKAVQIFRNFGFLTIGKILGDVFTFTFFVVLSRIFGQDGVGQYSFAMAFTGFFVVFADFGLYHLSIKEMSRERHSLGEYYGRIFLVRLCLSVTVLAVIALCAPLFLFPTGHRDSKTYDIKRCVRKIESIYSDIFAEPVKKGN
ncbi:MAG: oligosaccharide flippase family protein [Deltaproteobacteria bacterium]|jgi:O-antigen/teichoic acid export membrane protein|nr:oligosaccharide flippase family protein [Deltaproteobacteria bacterium]MDL1986103.1 oligosaccharide flippase family protein [Deltaproteobacteria bacterium]